MVRRLTVNDVPQVLELSSSAGWNQTAEDWKMIIELGPDSCFAMDCDGHLVATATLVPYGKRFAWLGMVLTHHEFRRRGFARMLVQRALAVADGNGIQTVKLDATDQGQPLYEALGFVAEQEIQRWSGGGITVTEQIGDRSSLTGKRPALVEFLRRRDIQSDEKDFVMHRDGLRASYLGPCVARTRESAERLIASTLALDPGGWFWDLFPGNSDVVALANRFGFRLERKLVRMFRGAPLRADESMVYAIAGFEFG